MCNACGFACCSSHEDQACGCDNCGNSDCWTRCPKCEKPEAYCECDIDDITDEFGDGPEDVLEEDEFSDDDGDDE